MNLLHVFSNWKWTGPAEHALNTAVHLMKMGHRVVFACATPPIAVEDSLKKRAEQEGLEIEEGLYLNKHFHPWQDTHDIIRLSRCIRRHGPGIIHTHLLNDHLLAAGAVLLGRHRVPIVRTVYEGQELLPTLRNRFLINHYTDSLITVSQASRRAVGRTFEIPAHRLWTICPGVDCERFNPQVDGSSVRQRYGIGADDPVVGIVARVQKHRRFDVFISALCTVIKAVPRLKVLIIGRGTHIEELAIKPIGDLKLENNILLTGYHLEGYRELLAAINVKVFLVPGSDGSCRAVREAMAMGKPVVAADRGMLPELVEDGVSGFVVEDSPDNLARAILTLVNDPPLGKKMGEAARQRILRDYNLTAQLEKVEDVYRQTVLSGGCLKEKDGQAY